MQAGRVKRKIAIFQTRGAEETNSFANPQDIWTDDFTDRCDLQTLGSREFPTDIKRFTETTARVHMRFRSDVDPGKHRIVTVQDRFSPVVYTYWTILGIYDIEGKQRELFIEVKEVKGTAG